MQKLQAQALIPNSHLCEPFTTFNFLSCANNDSNPFCRDHVNHIYDATSKQVKVGTEVEEEKGYVLRLVLLIITNVLRLCIT